MESKESKSFLKSIISLIGPGLITAAVVMGPGSITASSQAGATMGYSLLWAVALAGFMMIVFTRMGSTIGIMSKDSFLGTVTEKYGRIVAILIGVSGFLITTGFQTGNNIGVGLAFSAMFGGSVGIWASIFTIIAMVFLWSSSSIYNMLEKLMTVMVFIMIVTFFGNLFMIRPNGVELVKGFIPSKPEAFGLVVSISATTFSVAAAAFQTYIVRSKGWTKNDLSDGLKSSTIGIVILGLISMVIMITSATVLKPAGITVKSAVDMAMQLEPLLGPLAKWMFLFGLWSAAFSSFIVNAMIGGTFLADGLGLGKELDSKWSKIFASGVMILGTLASILFGKNPIQLLILAQGTTIFGVPLISTVMLLLSNNKDLMKEYKNKMFINIVSVLSIVWLLYLSYRQLMSFLK
ncbi:divalent metal cation transporter [Clostridium malenominatum]|uniref:Divalent metal cation transporter n=1 Tax=Clostridium malenominatum TaxID=1539 RepID=A0ABN1IKX2_9CLOT